MENGQPQPDNILSTVPLGLINRAKLPLLYWMISKSWASEGHTCGIDIMHSTHSSNFHSISRC
ncbi:hypothetical protein AAY473_040759 [Plecturocebus cupreus]